MSRIEAKKRANGVQTAAHILNIARIELNRSGPANFNLDRVQDEAGVSRSSLYHHFGNREGLIVAATIQEIHQELNTGVSDLRQFATTIDSGQVIVDYIKEAVRDTSSENRRTTRQIRAGTFAAGRHSEMVSQALKETEGRLLEDFTELLVYARDRKLLNPREPMAGTIAVISSMLMGRIVIDFLGDSTVEDAWVEVASDVVQDLLQPLS